MNSESGKSYMDKLKAKNIPPQVQAEMQTEEEIPTVQISVAEWDELIASVNRLEELSAELKAQKAAFAAEAGKLYRADCEGDTGAKRGDSGGDTEDLGGSIRTGWESERKSLESYLQKKHTGRRTVVASHGVRGSSDDTDLALMGIRGLESLTDVLEDDNESEEEKREREARNTGTALGVAAGIIVGMAIGLGQDEDGDIEEDEDENEDFGMTM